MEKVFECAYEPADSLEVQGVGGSLILTQKQGGRVTKVRIDHKTAPALALAILEAAGCKEFHTPAFTAAEYCGRAMYNLRRSVETQAKATAEAKEQAELETEAMRLRNAWHNDPLDETPPSSNWLAVARKARELAKGSGE